MRDDRVRRSKAAGLLLFMAVTVGLTGCGNAVESYTVEGNTGEVSMVTDEPFASVFSTMEYAHDEAVEGTSTVYEGTASAEESDTAATAEENRKWRTILEDVSLFSSPENGKVTMVVPKDSKVDVLTEKENGWYKIRYHGSVGYVKSGYFVEDWEEEQAERAKREEEERQRKAEAARKKAEEEAKKKAEAEKKKKEEEAKKKAAEEKKKKEEAAKKKAEEEKKKKEEEARKKAEEEKRKAEAEERARAMANGEVTRLLAETVNLRDPDDEEILFGIVPTGSYVTVLEDLGDGWYLVDYDGMEGMIKGGYFTEDDP
jgi:uncharacterized protein YgiM (DUF1202 family)